MENGEPSSVSLEEMPPLSTTFETLKTRIKEHYEKCSDYYLSLW
jgi:hypothetical protein